ncbi:hypothetical protein [Actinacidiphila acididurans]|uniref:Uncharacterized protein n=1 Tax=Actinacidiphila acididurans TaxID=2784346 RepID=A0ABS2U695_9ACTN|nr:hypothetical protein [Actinacidiphila acididurans]MBM9510020.1 hypothetical protein [Actinacidiphila acididurans]
MTVRAIDPPGCGCTDCLLEETGDSVPLDRATAEQVAALLEGRLLDHTGSDTTITVTIAARSDDLHWDLTGLLTQIPPAPRGHSGSP